MSHQYEDLWIKEHFWIAAFKNISTFKFNLIFPAFEPFFCLFVLSLKRDTGLHSTNCMKICVPLLLNTCPEPGKMASVLPTSCIPSHSDIYDIRDNSWANHDFYRPV